MLLHRPARLLLVLSATALLATGCSSSEDSSAPAMTTDTAAPTTAAEPSAPAASADATAPASPAAEAVTITISEFEYDVPELVPAGSEVEVVNQDRESHTLTRADGGASVVVQGGATKTFTAPKAGSYGIVCDFHGSMTAELVVA